MGRHDRKKKNLIAKQAKEIERITGVINEAEKVTKTLEDGTIIPVATATFKKSFLDTIKLSSMNANVAQMEKRLKYLKRLTNPILSSKLKANVKTYTYKDPYDQSKTITKRSYAARFEYSYQRQGTWVDNVDNAMDYFLTLPVYLVHDKGPNFLGRGGGQFKRKFQGGSGEIDSETFSQKIISAMNLVKTAYEANKDTMSVPQGGAIIGILTNVSRSSTTETQLSNILDRVYHTITSNHLPAEYSGFDETMSTIGTYAEDDDSEDGPDILY